MKDTLPKLHSRTIFLPAILLLALFFRLYGLGTESLWLDEVLSIKYAHLNLSQIFLLQKETPPLYYLVLHWWIRLFGISEFSVRFPSVIFGCLSVFMIYKLGSQLFDRNTGTLSSLLLAFSVFHIHYSQEARTYSLSVLLTLLSMYFFIRLLKEVSLRNLMGYILSSILLMYSHVYGLFIIIAQNIYFMSLSSFSKEDRKLTVKRWFSVQFLLILLFVPWVRIFVYKVVEVQGNYWIPIPHIDTIISSFRTYSSESTLLLVLFLVLVLFSLWQIRKLNKYHIYFLLIWLITPIVLPFIISQLSQPIYDVRYTIVASSAFYLLIARGIDNMHAKYVKLIVVSTVILLSMVSVRNYYAEITNEPWREVAEYIDANAHNGDVVLFNAPYYVQPFNYYSRSGLIVKKRFPEKGVRVDEKNIYQLLEAVKHYERIWLILLNSGDKDDLIVKTLSKFYNPSRLTVYYYRSQQNHIKVYFFRQRINVFETVDSGLHGND
jgi:mannosyltransferase